VARATAGYDLNAWLPLSIAPAATLQRLLNVIPAMAAFSYFRNKIDSLVSECGKRVERILMPLARKRTA